MMSPDSISLKTSQNDTPTSLNSNSKTSAFDFLQKYFLNSFESPNLPNRKVPKPKARWVILVTSPEGNSMEVLKTVVTPPTEENALATEGLQALSDERKKEPGAHYLTVHPMKKSRQIELVKKEEKKVPTENIMVNTLVRSYLNDIPGIDPVIDFDDDDDEVMDDTALQQKRCFRLYKRSSGCLEGLFNLAKYPLGISLALTSALGGGLAAGATATCAFTKRGRDITCGLASFTKRRLRNACIGTLNLAARLFCKCPIAFESTVLGTHHLLLKRTHFFRQMAFNLSEKNHPSIANSIANQIDDCCTVTNFEEYFVNTAEFYAYALTYPVKIKDPSEMKPIPKINNFVSTS